MIVVEAQFPTDASNQLHPGLAAWVTQYASSHVKLAPPLLRLQVPPRVSIGAACKTRMVDLRDGKQGFNFVGCHLDKRMSGRIWENGR